MSKQANDKSTNRDKALRQHGVRIGEPVLLSKLGARPMAPFIRGHMGVKDEGAGRQVTPLFDSDLVKKHWGSMLGFRSNASLRGLQIVVVAQKGDLATRLHATLPDEPKYRIVTKITTAWIYGRFTNMDTLRNLVRKTLASPSYEITSAVRKRFRRHLLPLEFLLMRNTLPAVVIFLNPADNLVAIKECRAMGIPVAAVADSGFRYVDQVDYLLPGSTRDLKSQMLYRQLIKEAIDHGLELRLEMLLSGEMDIDSGVLPSDDEDDSDDDGLSDVEGEVLKG